MGLNIERNEAGLYRATSTISDESITDDKWVTEDEFKKILIERAFWRFAEETIKIDMDFPNGYTVNEKRIHDENGGYKANRFLIQSYHDYNPETSESDPIGDKFTEICKRLDIVINTEEE